MYDVHVVISARWELRSGDRGGPGHVDPARRARDAAEAARAVICAACGSRLTDAAAAIEIAGRHRHTCVNPGGIVYRIACYARAPGCAGDGARSDYYSWFAGYAWQVLVCGGCRAHVGWAFHGGGPARVHAEADFAGLIADRIAEADA